MVYGYGCVTSTKIHRGDAEALKKTKAYTALYEYFVKNKLPVENIYIDLITGTYRKRKHFEWILANATRNDCVVITSIRQLGNVQEARQNYMSLYKNNIGLLIEVTEDENYSEKQLERIYEYSTALNYKLNPEMFYSNKGVQTKIVKNLEDMEEVQSWVPDNKGRPFEERPKYFKEVYWLYENYFLPESELYHNALIDISKKKFFRLAEEYEEHDPDYASDLREQNKLYGTAQKPKRHGKIPEGFDVFLKMLDNGERLKPACLMTKMPFTSMLEVNRYRLKYEGGKKAVAAANKIKDTPFAKEVVDRILYYKGDA